MKLTKNFSLEELTKNNWANAEQQKKSDESLTPEALENLQLLANNLQVLRDYLGVPVEISIAWRPKWWELLKGRSGNSQHAKGKAADIKVKGYSPAQIKEIIEQLIKTGTMMKGGLAKYNTFVHYDIRGFNARWNNKK